MPKPSALRILLEPFALKQSDRHLSHFEDVEARQRRRLAHYAGVCALVVLLYLIPDYFFIRDILPWIALCSFGLTIPFLLGAGILAHRGQRAAAELALLAAFTTLPIWVFGIMGHSRVDPRLLALHALTICCLMFIWYNATFGVRLWKPTLCYVIVAVTGIGMFLQMGELSRRTELSLALLVLSAGVMAFQSNLFMQRDERGFVSEGERLLDAIIAGRHDLWALDIPTGWAEIVEGTPSAPRRRLEVTLEQFMAMLHPDDREYVRDSVTAILQQGESKTLCEYRVISPGRECLWYESLGKVVEYDVSGNPVTLLGIRNNISDRKELTRQLQYQAEEIARATHAKSEFLATMSHEIRTPLNGILGMASLLEDADLSPSQREMVAVIRNSGSALLQILNDVLDFSRIEAGKLSIANASFGLHELIDHCRMSIEPAARRKSLLTGVSIAQNVPPQLRGDAVQLRTVLTHLLSNAVKFTDSGRIDLSISVCRPRIDGSEWLRFEIRDTGCGIHPESQEKLFTPFTQVHGKGFTADSGAGLGLALSKRLVDALGGTISCASQVGHGTCFTVELPFGVCAGSKSPQPKHETQPPRKDTRILVAEDNLFNQAVLRKMLERLGFRPAFVDNGQAAVEAIQQEDFDLVFMDCEMPILDGLEATRRIRALPGREQLPIVALSAHPAEEYKSVCEAAGMTDYVTKPISLDLLTNQMHRWASQSHPLCTA